MNRMKPSLGFHMFEHVGLSGVLILAGQTPPDIGDTLHQ